ncbi:MAG TPA: NADH:ubiquinone reductase (Na(+)-transporting) subunit B [Lutibacter sp.]|nr:NADH:ubiquinone reductase (Na(+)-transporting) subunit B [Lutibacter sp.]
MQFINNIMEKFRPHYKKGGKYEKYGPAFFGIDTFLFVPNHTTKSGAHIRDGIDLKRIMIVVVFALIPVTLFGIWNIGFQHFSQLGIEKGFWELFGFGAIRFLPMVVVSYAVGLSIEFAFAIFRGHAVNEGYLVSGLLIPLIMPIDLPLWMLAISVIFAVIIGKEAFGGTGMNILNPALVARAFAFFSYAGSMSGDTVWVADAAITDGVSGETVLGTLASGKEAGLSVMDMFIGYMPGSVGETSVLMILLGAGFLFFTGIANWRIMLATVVGGAVTALLFNLWGLNSLMEFPWWQHLMVGGFLFGAVFMATDPVTATQTSKGMWIYGFLIGMIAILVRVFNGAYPEGMMMAILLMNVFAPLIDHYIIKGNIKQRKNRLEKSRLKA